jgi:hypothetical protein
MHNNKAWLVYSICFTYLSALGGYSLNATFKRPVSPLQSTFLFTSVKQIMNDDESLDDESCTIGRRALTVWDLCRFAGCVELTVRRPNGSRYCQPIQWAPAGMPVEILLRNSFGHQHRELRVHSKITGGRRLSGVLNKRVITSYSAPRILKNVDWMLTECWLNVDWMLTECTLNVHWMYTECWLNVHWMFTDGSLIYLWWFTDFSLNVQWNSIAETLAAMTSHSAPRLWRSLPPWGEARHYDATRNLGLYAYGYPSENKSFRK